MDELFKWDGCCPITGWDMRELIPKYDARTGRMINIYLNKGKVKLRKNASKENEVRTRIQR